MRAAYQKRLREEERDQCGICLVNFQSGENLRVLPCPKPQNSEDKNDDQIVDEFVQGHMYHEECISEWFLKKPECPLCRHNFAPKLKEITRERTGIVDEEEKSFDDIENARGPTRLRFSSNIH